MFQKIIDEYLNILIENKLSIVVACTSIQFLLHKYASYYVLSGRKSLKGFLKFIIGKPDDPKT